MGIRVIAHFVAGGDHGGSDLRIGFDVGAYHEKRGRHVVGFEDLEDPGRVLRARTVVKGDGDPRPVGTSPAVDVGLVAKTVIDVDVEHGRGRSGSAGGQKRVLKRVARHDSQHHAVPSPVGSPL